MIQFNKNKNKKVLFVNASVCVNASVSSCVNNKMNDSEIYIFLFPHFSRPTSNVNCISSGRLRLPFFIRAEAPLARA